VTKVRILALILACASALCLIGLRGARTQSTSLRRVTNTTEEGINLNPSISGDGRILAFESTEDIASAGGTDHFRAIRANVKVDPATFFQMGGTRAVAPAISQDGSRIAFASKDDPLATNADGNSEIFLFDGAKLTQVTNTSPGDVANRIKNGNFQPSISDDGRFIAFSSNRDLAGENADGNLEIFIYDAIAGSFTQLTNSSGIVGSSDAKISGNGASVAYIRDSGATPSAQRDLLKQPRVGPGPVTLLAGNVPSLAITYGRAISDDGTRVVYAAETATNTTQVFLYDGRGGTAVKQITTLGARVTEVPLHPTISGDGTRVAFAARRSVTGAPANSDGGVELYVDDIPSSQVSKITNAPSSATADVVSSLNDDGSIVAFNFPRILSGAVANTDSANNSEVYITVTPPRPSSGAITVLNGASFGKEPSTTKAVAPDSIAVATGGALANTTQESQKLPNGTFPTNVGGTTVTVNGRAAQIFFVSPGQVNFLVPPQTEIGTVDVVVTNSENFPSRGTVPTLRAAPGVFTKSGDGAGPGVILNSDTLLESPFDPTNGSLRLTIFTTGARNAGQTVVSMGGRVVNADAVMASPDMPGLDEVHVLVPTDLRGAGTVDLFVQSDGRASNPVSVTFAGDASRDIAINEVLIDPPTGTAGDANLDGTRDSAQDEFVEFVNATTHDIDINGYQLLTRSSTTTTDTLQHTFAGGTILPACSAIVVFGGGTFDPANPAFGGAQVVKASTNGLSLSNSGGVVTLRNQSGAIVTFLSYGGSTGLNGQASQALTRSPDVTGPFTLHQSATGNGGRLFSPGTRVNGAPFTACPPITRIVVSPQSAAIDAGAKQQFTAQAFDSANNPVTGVIFSWQSSTTAVATIDQNGLATSSTAGSTEIRAFARGLQSAPAALTVREVQRVLTRVDVTPPSATVAATGAQQFTGHGIDQFGNEIVGLTFAWESSNPAAATVDQTGLATGVAQGQSTIKATTQSLSGTATLNVTAPTMVVNEVLADPPTGTDGDANHDGTRDAADDEFVELVNSTNSPMNISGWTVRTHATSSATETVRHTFAANTNFPAGEAMVVFGGGTFSPSNPLFGCAQVVKASSGGLSLTNGGLTILVRDGSGNLVTQFSYGGTTGLNGGNAQSLTRSPDITGSFVLHTTIPGARKFSSGLKVDGTPFGNCPGHPATVTIAPAVSSVIVEQTTQFTAQAFDQFGRAMIGVPITFASDNTTAATVDSVSTNPSTGIATATLRGHNQGTAHITSQANDGTTTATSSQATLTVIPPQPTVSRVDVSPASATINRGNTQQFNATAFDQNNQPVAGVVFTWSSSSAGAATIDQNGLANGVGIGATTITATASDGASGSVSGSATLNVQIPVVINEINADVGPDNVATTAIEGDANRDGVRDSSDDEFIELLNNSTAPVNISGVVIADATSNRFTIPANTTLAAGRALVIFGGGSPPVNDPAFGGALVLALTGSGTLSLNDTGDTVNVKLSVAGADVPITSLTYGGAGNPAAPSDQSLTRSPDGEINSAGGSFGAHTAATNAAGRLFSPGTRTDGTPFGSPAITRIEVTPASATINAGQTQGFNARAFSNVGGPEVEIQNVCFIWESSDTSKATLAPITGVTTNATGVGGGGPTIRARAGGQQGTATLTVNVPPTLTINDVSLNEGNSGSTTFHFVVSLSAPALTGGVTFDIATQDGTATVTDNDYVARVLTGQTIAAGQQTYNFDVTVNGDVNIEPNETFLVNVTNVSDATVGDGQGAGTIQNDDSPTLNINDVSASEGNSGTTTFTFTVTSTLPAPAGGITFDIATADGTATTANNDYVARSLTSQTIPAGQTVYTFDVTVNGDLLVEPNESFVVNLANPANATIGHGQGVGTIQNDDTANLVISQVYGGGDNSGAPFRNDFVEVYNHGTTTVDFSITPYSIQYASVGSNFGTSKTNLTSGTLPPGRYFLVQESGGTTNGVALPTPDVTGTIALAGTAGKVALVAGTTALATTTCPGDDGSTPFNPSNAEIADLVGYGNSATTAGHCYEGTGPAVAPSNTTADFRKAGGCVDTNDNAADFFAASPNPRNTSSPIGDCKPDITINDVTVTEGNTGTVNATFTVTLSAASARTVTVDYATADGTATQPADYQATGGTLTFNPGDLTKTITVLVNGDTLDEPTETFFVNLANATNGALVDNQGQGTITDNDPTPSLSINDVSVAEGDSGTTPATFTVTLSTASGQTVMVNYATADNTAGAGSDYQSTSGTLTFNPGDTTRTVTVLVNGDTTFEQAETFFVNLSSPTNATISDNQGLGTITNDDAAPPTPTFFITDVSVAEGDAGTSTATFTVTLSPASSQAVTVDFSTANGTATIAGNDFQSATGTLTFNPGDTSKPINVNINGDTLVESDETFLVKLTNATGGAGIGVPQSQGTITNDDTPLLVISQLYGGGGNSGATYKNDFIEIFNRGATTVDLAGWSVQQASAAGTSWSVTPLCPSGSCLLTPGKYFLVQEFSGGVVGATLPGPDASGTSNLSVASGKIALVNSTTALTASGCPFGAGVIDFVGYGGADCSEGSTHAPAHSNTTADFRKSGGCIDTGDNAADFVVSGPGPRNSAAAANDCSTGFRPDITINDVTVTEGDAGTKTADFTVTLAAPNNTQTVTVDYATGDGTAAAGLDYQSSNGTVSFAPGETSKPVSITIIGDTTDEPNETFFVNLSNAANSSILDNQGQGTITDDDVPPALTIVDVSLNEGNSGSTTFHFVVSLSAPALTGGVTFDIATQDGTATVADNDYVARALTGQTIAAGQQTYNFDVTVTGDVNIEPNETFLVNVTNVSGATVGDGQGAGTIQNDDSPTLNINDVSASEGNSGTTTFTFTVTSSLPAPAGGITFDIATANSTATTANNDYVARSLTSQTIAAGLTTYTFDVTVNGDLLVESDEAFLVNVTPVSGASAGDTQGMGTIKNDDTPLVVISQVYGGGGNSGAIYKNDFIEVFNRGTTTVDLAGWSVQENSATSTSAWSVTPLCSVAHCLLSPGQYFLIQEASGGAAGAALPTPDATGSIAMSASTGKVALVSDITPLSGACPSTANILDRVGYGSTAGTVDFCFEGPGPAPTPSATTADLRAAAGCTDTNNNIADFATGSPNPRNTASPLHDCNAPPTLTSVTITPAQATIGVGDTQQFTAQAFDQFGQPIGGVTVTFASNNTGVATVDTTSPTSGTGSATGTVTGHATGSTEIRASATNGSTNVTSSPAALSVEPAAGQVLISEFRTRGTGGATDEFIEIYNPTAPSVVIGGLVIRSSNNAGTLTTRATITAGAILGPGCHYLFAPTTFSGFVTTPPDQTFTNGITDDGGIAITRSDLVTVIDAVGMSSGSAYKESPTLVPLAGTTNQSYERKPGGASGNGTDTNSNAADFVLNSGTSNPQNSSSGCLDTTTADLSITKTDSPDPVTVGSVITYTLTVTNNGIGVAQSAQVVDDLPSSLTYVSCNSTGSGVCGGTGNHGTVDFSSLAVGSSATITLVATVNGTGGASISNTASVGATTTDPNPANNTANTTTTVSAADLSITKSNSPDPVNAGENITYTLVVTNNSSTIPAQSVTVSDQLPANTTFVSVGATPAGWSRTDSTAVGQTGTVTYTVPTLAASGTATFTIAVKVDSNAANNSTISNTATVGSNTPDDNSANNSATQTTTVRTPADLSISKTVNNASPNVGEQVTFTITVSNGGPYSATGVVVKDQLPTGLSYLSDDGGGAYVSGTGIWTVGTVNAAATATLHITAQVTATAVNGVTNTTEVVASDQFDPDSTPNTHIGGEDDQANASVTARSADLSLTKTVDISSPTVGQDVTFTITLSNAGPSAATNVLVKDLLPAGLAFVSSTQSQGSYISSSGIWTVASVNASGSATLTITATVQSAGTLTNIAEVTAADEFDPDSTPNNQNAGEDDQAARAISTLQADLSLVKLVDNPTPNVGENIVFTITVSNAGPSPATNVQVKDLLPVGLTYASDDGGGAYVSGTGVWTVGTVNASANATLHITATATSASISGVTNTAEITASDVPDPDSTPNNHIGEDDQSSVGVNAKEADLSITKSDSPDPVLSGSNITYTINVTNGGPDPSLNLTLSDTVPGNTTFQSLTPAAGWTCPTFPAVGGTGAISCTASSLAASQTDSFTLVVKVDSGVAGSTIISNTASVSSGTTFDPTSANNSVSQMTTVQPSANLSITKTDSPDPVVVGNDITYTITINNGGLDAAASAAFSDTVPTNTTFRSLSSVAGWACTQPAVGGTGSISCTNPSFAVGSVVFTLVVRVDAAVADGTSISNTASIGSSTFDPDTNDNSTTATTTAKTPLLVISQIYGGGGNSGAQFTNDFIEIFNRGTTTVDLAGWSVQHAAAAGSAWQVTPLCATGPCLILPGRYFLVREGASGATNLPSPDATDNIAMTAGAGKVALSSSTTALNVACPSGGDIKDFVGYGSSANCFEGTGSTAAPGNTTAAFRKAGGCIDSNNNAADFFVHAPSPRNSSTPANTCSGQTADIVISDVTVTEGDSGTVSANFTVSLIASSADTVTVDYATANGTAVEPDDYTAIPTTQLVFNPGETSKPVSVLVKGDTLDEPDETFFVNLTNATNAAILDSQGQGTITDNDVPPTLTINDVSQNEGNSLTTTFAFTVHLSAPALTGGVTFDIATADGTAQDHNPITEDNDYVGQSLGAVTIPAGTQDYVFKVTVNGDTNIETNETFVVNVTNVVRATVGDSQGLGTIQNDDSPTLSINDVTQTEGDSGTSIFTFTVTSSLPAPAGGITFDIATADGTAQDHNPVSEDSDYVARSLLAQTIPATQTTYTFDVTVNGDTKNEAICETFFVNVTNPINATILDGTGQGGITDNDGTKLVISQVYGGGGNVGAPYTNDFIEIFNRGNTSVSLSGLSVQYAAATGTSWSVTNLSGTLAAGKYFLIQESSGANGVALPTPDASGTIAMAAGTGKVALVSTTVALTVACPSGATIIDFVGYGTTANCFEGSGPAPVPSATVSDLRGSSGCIDTANNASDFAAGPPNPRNSATSASSCSCSTSYSSLFVIGGESWRDSLARLSIEKPRSTRLNSSP
jgi:uncharacterized repeat protein (TIGR01451 family)